MANGNKMWRYFTLWIVLIINGNFSRKFKFSSSVQIVPSPFRHPSPSTNGVRWVFTQDKRRKNRKNLILSLSIGLPSLTIFRFSPKISCEKCLAVKAQVFILSKSTPLPNVKQHKTRKKNTAKTDTRCSDRF